MARLIIEGPDKQLKAIQKLFRKIMKFYPVESEVKQKAPKKTAVKKVAKKAAKKSTAKK